nr:TPA_asm: polyprotein [Zebrafish picornavirus 1]
MQTTIMTSDMRSPLFSSFSPEFYFGRFALRSAPHYLPESLIDQCIACPTMIPLPPTTVDSKYLPFFLSFTLPSPPRYIGGTMIPLSDEPTLPRPQYHIPTAHCQGQYISINGSGNSIDLTNGVNGNTASAVVPVESAVSAPLTASASPPVTKSKSDKSTKHKSYLKDASAKHKKKSLADPATEDVLEDSDRVGVILALGNSNICSQSLAPAPFASPIATEHTIPISHDAISDFPPLSEHCYSAGTFEYTVSSPLNVTLKTFSVASVLNKSNVLSANASCFENMSFDAYVAVTLNSTKFHSGLLMIVASPCPFVSMGAYLTNFRMLTMLPHGYINLAETNGCSAALPFASCQSSVNLRVDYSWHIAIVPIAPLGAIGGSVTSLVGNVQVGFTNVTAAGVILPFKNFLETASFTPLGPFPAQNEHFYTRSAPGNGAFGNVQPGSGIPLAYSCAAPEEPNLPGEVHDFLEIARIPGYVQLIDWATGLDPGVVFAEIDVSPCNAGAATPCAMISSLFAQWSGSLINTFKISAAAMSAGRFLACYSPDGRKPQDLSEAMTLLHSVYDLGLNKEFTFVTPFVSRAQFVSTRLCLGKIFLVVVAPYIAPRGAPTSATVIHFTAAGDDFQFKQPIVPEHVHQGNDGADPVAPCDPVPNPLPPVDSMEVGAPAPPADTNIAGYFSMFRARRPIDVDKTRAYNYRIWPCHMTGSFPTSDFTHADLIFSMFSYFRCDASIALYRNATAATHLSVAFLPSGATHQDVAYADGQIRNSSLASVSTLFANEQNCLVLDVPYLATTSASSAISDPRLNDVPRVGGTNSPACPGSLSLSVTVNATFIPYVAYRNTRAFLPRPPAYEVKITPPVPTIPPPMILPVLSIASKYMCLTDSVGHVCDSEMSCHYDGEKFRFSGPCHSKSSHIEVTPEEFDSIVNLSKVPLRPTDPTLLFSLMVPSEPSDPPPRARNEGLVNVPGIETGLTNGAALLAGSVHGAAKEFSEGAALLAAAMQTSSAEAINAIKPLVDSGASTLDSITSLSDVFKTMFDTDVLNKVVKAVAVLACLAKDGLTTAAALAGLLFLPEILKTTTAPSDSDSLLSCFKTVFKISVKHVKFVLSHFCDAFARSEGVRDFAPWFTVLRGTQNLVQLVAAAIGYIFNVIERKQVRSPEARFEKFKPTFDMLQEEALGGGLDAALIYRKAVLMCQGFFKEIPSKPNTLFTYLNTCRANADRMVQMAKPEHNLTPLRPEPVVIYIYGEPGCGKSFAATAIANYLCEMHGVDPNAGVFSKSPDNQYFDGYNGQLVHIIDDLGQAPDGSDYKEFALLVSSTLYIPSYADLANKGTPYTTPFIIVTSNFSTPTENAARCLNALSRRFHLYYHAVPSKRYMRGNTIDIARAIVPTPTSTLDYADCLCPLTDGTALRFFGPKGARSLHGVIYDAVMLNNSRGDNAKATSHIFKTPYELKVVSAPVTTYCPDLKADADFNVPSTTTIKYAKSEMLNFSNVFMRGVRNIPPTDKTLDDLPTPDIAPPDLKLTDPGYDEKMKAFQRELERYKSASRDLCPACGNDACVCRIKLAKEFTFDYASSCMDPEGCIATWRATFCIDPVGCTKASRLNPKKLNFCECDEAPAVIPTPKPCYCSAGWTPLDPPPTITHRVIAATDDVKKRAKALTSLRTYRGPLRTAWRHIKDWGLWLLWFFLAFVAVQTTVYYADKATCALVNAISPQDNKPKKAKKPVASEAVYGGAAHKPTLHATNEGLLTEPLYTLIKPNQVVVTNSAGFPANGLMLGRTIMLTNTHMFANRPQTMTLSGHGEVRVVNSYVDGDHLFVDLDLPTQYRDLRKHVLVAESDVPVNPTRSLSGYLVSATPTMVLPTMSVYRTSVDTDLAGLVDAYTYTSVHFDGLCGSPLLLAFANGLRLGGIHTAGAGHATGYSTRLTREMCNKAFDTLARATCEGVRSLVGPITPGSFIPRKSVLKPSPLHGVYPVTKIPAALSDYSRTLDPGVSLDDVIFKKFTSDVSTPWDTLAVGYDIWKAKAMLPEPTLFTVEMALNGAACLDPIDMSLSVGYPYTGLGLSRNDFVTRLPDGTLTPTPLLLREMEKFRSNPEDFYFATFLKDELRTIPKAKAGKTRVVDTAPFPVLVCMRVAFGSFYSFMHANPGVRTGSAVGCNPDIHWTAFANGFAGYPDVFDIDYSCYDGTVPSAAFEVLIDNVSDMSVDPDAGKMLRWACYSKHVYGAELYQIVGGMPSGMSGTSVFNTVLNNTLILSALATSPLFNPDDYAILAYGDDVLYANRNTINPSFVADFLGEKAGMVLTPASKAGTFPEHSSIRDVTFLKRSFVPCPTAPVCWLAPIDPETIKQSCMWLRKGALGDVLTSLSWLLFHHGQTAYDEFCRKCNAHLIRNGFPPFSFTAFSYLFYVWSANNGITPLPQPFRTLPPHPTFFD